MSAVVRSYKGYKEMAKYGSVGLELLLSIAVGYFLGRWVDRKWAGGHGYVTAVGSLVGVYAGFRSLWVAGKRMTRDIERAERLERGEEEEDSP